MNTSFRSVWNPALAAWVAVSEIARTRGKSVSSAAGIVATALCLSAAPALAGSGGLGGRPATPTTLFAGDGGADNVGGAGGFNDGVTNGTGGAGGSAGTAGASEGGAGTPGTYPAGVGALGGAAGTAAAPNGLAGGGFDVTNPAINGYGGGGGGGFFGGTGASGSNTTPLVGGNGGAGGTGIQAAGGGGAGGYGVVLAPAVTPFTNSSQVTGGNGGSGGAASAQAGGGGGGGSGLWQTGGVVANTGSIIGGAGGLGGAGGNAVSGPSGGGGGGGGDGLLITGGSLRNEAGGYIVGGTGGRGGDAGPNVAGAGRAGAGGSGGDGVRAVANGVTLVNEGSLFGGVGGGGGNAAAGGVGAAGAGGVGVRLVGDNNVLVNASLIVGGQSRTNVRANAVDITGASNTVELRSGQAFIGDVVATGAGNVLALGGDVSPATPFSVAPIGTAFRGFAGFEKTGESTWTLTGTTTAVTPWTVRAGVLQITNDSNLGAPTGGLAFDGGTIRLVGAPADWTTSRAVSVRAGGGTLDLDQQSATFNGALSGPGAFTVTSNTVTPANFGGVLTLNAAGTRTGITTLSNGVNVNVNVTDALGTGAVALVNGWNKLNFNGAASAGAVVYTVGGLDASEWNNGITFNDASRAGTAVFNLRGADTLTSFNTIDFKGTSSAESAQINGQGGFVTFADNSTAGASTLVNDSAGYLIFTDAASGGTASITNKGASQLLVFGDAQLATARVSNLDTSTVDISGANAGVAIGSLRGAGAVSLGANALTLGGLNLDDAISGVIDGSGALHKIGTGALTLSGANTYTGATDIAEGTLRAGAANTLSAVSAHTVAAGATLDTAGFNQRIASLANSGTVSLLSATPGSTLTVIGAYVGNGGVLRLGTALGDSGSLSDRLVLDGIAASATGHTTVQITNVGGLGALTTGDGISVVTAQNGATTAANAFTLAGGHVDAGAFEYRLVDGDAAGAGESWFLRSTTTVVPVTPVVPVAPVPPVTPENPAEPAPPAGPVAAPAPAIVRPTYRAEVPMVTALPSILREGDLAMLSTLHRRVGDQGAVGTSAVPNATRAWGRLIGGNTTVTQSGATAPESRTRIGGFQTGVDLVADDRWNAGLYVGKLRSDARVDGVYGLNLYSRYAGSLRSDTAYLGGYATYANAQGQYADFVLQYGRHDIIGTSVNQVASSSDGKSLSASAEIGQRFAMGTDWGIEPQAQLIYNRQSLDTLRIGGLTTVALDTANAVIGRLGVRITGDFTTGIGRLQPYGRLNLWHGFKGADQTTFIGGAGATGFGNRIGYTSVEVAAGATLAVTNTTSVYGELGSLTHAGGSASKVKSSVQGSVGVKLRF
ncbi:autotransporter outer membrane beta-barrel domain-containing protein [Variovorax sp. PAMC 28711]|uniref:autotransporter outer membrane beta-barrel domain-containing protein n=1 Tax=Variovorax sp. PAMC 28711 TaxID=1795631 RepID=UPI00078B1CD7|nr:autotransporter outer membrane beta-barrel domain-containing protein [Variovorax sp. PAMC 28711]AMM25173.1 hypothetical protein AX767_12990 [Variovorax sp. PAMC 28711]